MAFVYIVTSGEYSNYGIEAVFSTKKKADEYIAARRGRWEDASAEKWELDDYPGPGGYGKRFFLGRMDRDGNVNHNNFAAFFPWDSEEYYKLRSGQLHFGLWGTDLPSVAKIVNEKRVQMIASGEWTE